MQENKYFYKGIPLSEYCKDNDININSIRSRIWKKKHNKKYENYTEQEIVDMVMEAYGSAVKYMYKGGSLRQYCKDNGINIGTINSRISALRKKNKNLSNDELVILAMENFNNQNYRFFYKGIPLKEYCKSHPAINYSTIITYINREKVKNKELSDEEIIEQYLNKEHKGIYKYYYLGIPLKQYCDENNLSYKNIILYMNRYRNMNSFKELSDDEFVEAIMEKYQPFEPKYLYKGITLREYCIQNDLSYYSVVSFIKRKLARGSNKSIDDLIDEGIKTINRYGIIYYYNGISLKDYAKQNALNASSIRCAILRKRLRSNKPLQEIINECVETYQKFSIKYFYDGIPLITYCNSIGLNYNTVINKYLDEYADYVDKKNISIDDAIKEIVDYYIENPPIRTKYYFNNHSLARFCDINGYPYFAIWNRIKTLESKDESLNSEQIVEKAIKKYEDRLEINRINEIFNKLKSGNINEIKDICEFLKIDFENISDLLDMDFSYNQAINMVWYFSDVKNEDDYKMITDKKIKDIFVLIDKLKKPDIEIEKFELYDLIGIYKSELYDSRNEMLQRQNKYIHKIIISLCREYEVNVNGSNYEDFESELKLYFITFVNRVNLNIYGQIIKYMDLNIKGYFRTYLKKYKRENSSFSFDVAKYSNDKGTRKEKPLIDFIADSNNSYLDIEDISFSSNMLEILETLPKDDLSLIMLKYQENYSDEELATYLNLTVEEVRKKEIEILTLLKNNDNIKVMRKKCD